MGYHTGRKAAFAAVLPRNCCPSCRAKARDEVLRAKKVGGMQGYFVQDSQEDMLERI